METAHRIQLYLHIKCGRFLEHVRVPNGGPDQDSEVVARAGPEAVHRPVKSSAPGNRAGTSTRYTGELFSLFHRTLDGYRVSGDGLAFHRFGNRVRYRRSDLDAWAT